MTFTSIVLPGDKKIREVTPDGIMEHPNPVIPDQYWAGVWVFERLLGGRVRPLRFAEPSERSTLYDELGLPQVTVLPVQKTSAWLCMPANLNAYEKSVKAKVPLPLWFAPETISMFDPVLARVYKQRRTYLLYEDFNERFPTQTIMQMRDLYALWVKKTINPIPLIPNSGLSAELRACLYYAVETSERPIESMCRYALKLSSAILEKVEDMGSGQYRVNYKYKGYSDSVIVNDTLTVLNSGICLDGNDQNYDLSSIVFVKDKKHRGDIEEEEDGYGE